MVPSGTTLPRLYLLRNGLIALFCLISCFVGTASGSRGVRGLQIPPAEVDNEDTAPKGGFRPVTDERDVMDDRESAYYRFDVDGLRPSMQPSLSPTVLPSANPTRLPQNTPREPIIDTEPPTNSPTMEPSPSPTTEAPTQSPTEFPTEGPTQGPTDSQINEEVVQAEEQDDGEQDNQRDPVEDSNPDDPDQFLPVADPTYYRVDLRPFEVFVDSDRDLSSDLGIPLYLLLEMGESLTSLVDIKITNLTIHMGVVRTPTSRRALAENHYHSNQLLFQGFAQLDDSTVYEPEAVQEVQSNILRNPDGLQQFWNDEGFGETYNSLELRNISLLPFPGDDEPDANASTAETEPPTQETPSTVTPEIFSKRDSNVWILVPVVLAVLLICFCIICLAGRLQYLASRAQDKYDEKYGLDYNIYDKDISKDIFKEEYLMSENQDSDFGHSDHVRSMDFLTKPRNAVMQNNRRSSGKKKVQFPTEENSTTEEDEEIQGEGELSPVPTEERAGAFPSIAPRSSMDRNVVVDSGMVLPALDAMPNAISDSDSDDCNESVPPDEDEMVAPHSSTNGFRDKGDEMPTVIKIGSGSLLDADTSEKDMNVRSRDERSRGERSRDDATFASKDTRPMGNLSSGRDRSGRYQNRTSSFNSTGSDRGVMGSSSRGSRGDRSSRFGRKGSFNAGEESNAMGGSIRSTRSNRSIRSATSDSSMGSFYSCQGDLV